MRMGKPLPPWTYSFQGIGEIVGGSQREERMDKLTERMEELGISQEELWVVPGYQEIWNDGRIQALVWDSNGWYNSLRAWGISGM